MSRKAFLVCALFFASAFAAQAAPITYKEIAMLLRNGEDPQFIREDTLRRKLLEPLTPQQEANLRSLGASSSLMHTLRAPAVLATPDVVAATLEQQRLARQQQKDEELRAQKAASDPRRRPRLRRLRHRRARVPMDMQFDAVDGTAVDLANMRGKVVLIDFWATWCGPCIMQVPTLVAAYSKYHDQGLEIIGVSLDQNKMALVKFIQSSGMPWPEFFDGKGWDNGVSRACNIHDLPTLWLVNKQGVLVNKKAQTNLEADIEKLLDE